MVNIFLLEQNASKNNNIDLKDTLYQSTSHSTVGDALFSVLSYAERYNLSWVAILDLFDLINRLIGNKKLPTSKYKLFNMFSFDKNITI